MRALKTDKKTFLKKVEKSLKKCLTSDNGLWYDIQAVTASRQQPELKFGIRRLKME